MPINSPRKILVSPAHEDNRDRCAQCKFNHTVGVNRSITQFCIETQTTENVDGPASWFPPQDLGFHHTCYPATDMGANI